MKKVIFLIAVLFMTIQATEAQTFDLANITFPFSKATIAKYKPHDKQVLTMKYRMFESTDPALLVFNHEKFSGHVGGKDDFAGVNLVNFYNDDVTSKIHAYRLETYTTAESKKLLKAVQLKLGKAGFDQGNRNRYRIWETADGKVIYLMEYGAFSLNNGQKTEFAKLFAIDKKATDLVNQQLRGGFQYYKDYLREKAGKKGKYTFTDFLKEMKAQGQNSYLQEDHTIK